MSIDAKGLRETIRNLERTGTEVSDLKVAMQRIGSSVLNEARRLAPVLTGRLVSTIRLNKSKNKSVIRAGGAKVPYAGVIHFGGYQGIQPRPFLTDALSNKQSEVINTLDNELQSLISKIN